MNDLPHSLTSWHRRLRLTRTLRLAAALALLAAGSGCAYSEKQPLIKAQAPPERLLEIATDPLRPLADRLAGAHGLDPAGRRRLETALLDDLPELWGLEWRERLALLGAVGSEATVRALEDMNARGELPTSEPAQTALERTIRAIETRLDVRGPAVPPGP